MKITHTLRAAGFALIMTGGAHAATPLETLDGKFDAAMATIEQQYDADRQKLMKVYRAHLGKVEAVYKQRSELDALIAVKNEIARMDTEKKLTALDVNREIKLLGDLQEKVLAKLEEYEGERLDKQYRVCGQVITLLTRMQGDLVKEDKIDQALAVKTRIEEIQASEPYIQAKIAADEAEERRKLALAERRKEIENNTPDITQPITPTIAPTDRDAKGVFPDRAAWYVKGDEPRHGDIKRITANYPSMAAKAAAAKMAGNLFLAHLSRETIKDSYSSYYSYYYEKDYLNRYVPRIEINPNIAGPYENVTVFLEYFTRGRGSNDPVKAFTEKVVIPRVESNTSYVIDGWGYSTRKNKERYYRDQFYTYFGPQIKNQTYSSSRYERNYVGFIASVYDKDNKLLFQRSTSNALDDHARATFSPALEKKLSSFDYD